MLVSNHYQIGRYLKIVSFFMPVQGFCQFWQCKVRANSNTLIQSRYEHIRQG